MYSIKKSKIIGHHLFMASLTPLFVGLVSAILAVMEIIKFDYRVADLSHRFIFSGAVITLAIVMMFVAYYHLRRLPNKASA